jgi:hypothetical protein
MNRKEIVELELPDGQIGYIEVEGQFSGDAAGGGMRRLAVSELGPTVRSVTKWLMDEVGNALPGAPQKVGLEFGLKLTAKTGKLIGVIAEAGTGMASSPSPPRSTRSGP